MHSFNKYLLNADCVPGVVLGVRYSVLNKTYQEFLRSGFPRQGHLELQRFLGAFRIQSHGCCQRKFYSSKSEGGWPGGVSAGYGIRHHAKLGMFSLGPGITGGHDPICGRYVHRATGRSLGKMTLAGKAVSTQRPRLTAEGRWREEGSEDQCGNSRDWLRWEPSSVTK